MSGERGPKYLESVYLFGTPDEIVASLQARVDAGVEYFFLHTMTPDPAQLQAVGRPHHPERHVPGDRRTGPPPEPTRWPSPRETARPANLCTVTICGIAAVRRRLAPGDLDRVWARRATIG